MAASCSPHGSTAVACVIRLLAGSSVEAQYVSNATARFKRSATSRSSLGPSSPR